MKKIIAIILVMALSLGLASMAAAVTYNPAAQRRVNPGIEFTVDDTVPSISILPVRNNQQVMVLNPAGQPVQSTSVDALWFGIHDLSDAEGSHDSVAGPDGTGRHKGIRATFTGPANTPERRITARVGAFQLLDDGGNIVTGDEAYEFSAFRLQLLDGHLVNTGTGAPTAANPTLIGTATGEPLRFLAIVRTISPGIDLVCTWRAVLHIEESVDMAGRYQAIIGYITSLGA